MYPELKREKLNKSIEREGAESEDFSENVEESDHLSETTEIEEESN